MTESVADPDNDTQISAEQAQADEALRQQLKAMLEGGLKTEVEPRAYSHDAVLDVVSRLQKLAADDYAGKLAVAGFTAQPYTVSTTEDDEDEQACETCMYYLVHRRFCELPELMLPVEENWSCRLWRI